MKSLLIIGLIAFNAIIPWKTDFEAAKLEAKTQHKLILLNFSGSDWCGPCIRMHKEYFADPGFIKMANDNLLMINADFPRDKKKQAIGNIKKQNEALADKYNPMGKFPFTLILDANGKVLKSYEGVPNQNVMAFTTEVEKTCDANK